MADEENEQSPWTRPGFIASAVVILLIVVAGVVVTVLNLNRGDTEPVPPSTSQPSSPEPSGDAGGASICGLEGVELSGRLSIAPAAEWSYQDTVAYPTSDEFGPGDSTPEGVRFCFQRSPEGALFAATNAVVQGADPATVESWLEYFLAAGPNRDTVLNAGAGSTGTDGVRVDIAGFRLLAYDGDTATVDVAVRGSAQGQAVTLSMVYKLVWEAGDWKLVVSNPTTPIDVAVIPDLAGYITWRA